MRTVTALVLTGLMTASLAGCAAAGGNPPTGDCESTAAGSVSDAVKVTGDFGSQPTVAFAEPLTLETTERTVVIDGDGGDQFVQIDDDITVDFALYNGTTGEEVTNSYDAGAPQTFTVNDSLPLPGLVKTLACAQVGQRIVGVIPPAEAFGAEGAASLSIAGGQSIVFVADVVAITPPAPPVEPEDYSTGTGLPEVTLNGDAEPTVTIPDAEPTDELRVAVIEEGDGDVVARSDSVSVLYYGVDWQTGKVFDKSWDLASPATFSLSGVVPGFAQAIAGRTVGSTVLTVIPPDLAYGPSGGSGDIGATDTIVFVIKIVAITPAG